MLRRKDNLNPYSSIKLRPAYPSKGKKVWFWLRDSVRDLFSKFYALSIIAFFLLLLWGVLIYININFGVDIINYFKSNPYIGGTLQDVFREISRETNLGVFYVFLFSSFFFLPIPAEIYFVRVALNHPPNETYLYIAVGIAVGLFTNFLMGKIFRGLSSYIKKSTRRKIANYLHEKGAVSIFGMNALPLPHPPFNFLCAVFRYPFFKWYTTALSAQLIKYAVVVAFISLFI